MTALDHLITASTASNARLSRLYDIQRRAAAEASQAIQRILAELSPEDGSLIGWEVMDEVLNKAVGLGLDDLIMAASDDADKARHAVDDVMIEAEETAHTDREVLRGRVVPMMIAAE